MNHKKTPGHVVFPCPEDIFVSASLRVLELAIGD